MNEQIYNECLNILREELVPAMGCTEPIAVAYCSALARDTLGALPDKIAVTVSGNILKNVKSVVVPNTGGMRGVACAAAAGAVAGDAQLKLEALSHITQAQREQISAYCRQTEITVQQSRSGCIFDIGVRAYSRSDEAYVRIALRHTNVVEISRNGKSLFHADAQEEADGCARDPLSVKNIVEFADCVRLCDVQDLIERQIEYNSAIAEEGLKGDYGAKVGKVLLTAFGNNVHNLAKATAAAGSDARMNGCSLPVLIVSGSGNQGLTITMPIVEYAKELNASHEQLIRAMVLANLTAVRIKQSIGCLSAYCGAICAGCSAAAGVAFLYGEEESIIEHTVVNGLAILSGTICDGAKPSCAAKIAMAVHAGLLGFQMAKEGKEFVHGEGIIKKGIENTIEEVGVLSRDGMNMTNKVILDIMVKE